MNLVSIQIWTMTILYNIRKKTETITWKKSIQIIIGISLYFSTSCIYDPNDRYIIDLEAPKSSPEVTIDLNFDSDTVYFSEEIPIVLKITSSNENVKVESVDLYVDNKRIYYQTKNDTIFTILSNLTQEVHRFKIEFTTNSGTTSIADKIGAEKFQFQSREIIFIVQSQNASVKWIKEFESTSGLSLTWKSGCVFNSYRLIKDVGALHRSFDTILNNTDNTYFDSKYIGENARYYLYGINNTTGKTHFMGVFSPPIRLPKMRVIEYQNKLALTWPKGMHTDHIKRIELIETKWINSSRGPNIMASLQNTDTLFFLDESYFGERPELSLRFFPDDKINEKTMQGFDSEFQGLISVPGPQFPPIWNSCTELYYIKRDTIFKYSTEQLKITPIEPYTYDNYTYGSKYRIQSFDNSLKIYSVSPYSLIREINITDNSIFNPSVSNNGIVTFLTNNALEIYDLNNNKLHITSMKYNRLKGYYFAEISPIGNYLIIHKSNTWATPPSIDVFAKIQNDSLITLDSIPNYWIRFHEKDPTLFYYYTESTLTIKNIEDLSTIRNINTGDLLFGNIDFCTNRMITKGKDSYHIYDILTGELLFTLPLQKGSDFYLLNNVVFFDYGNKYILAK